MKNVTLSAMAIMLASICSTAIADENSSVSVNPGYQSFDVEGGKVTQTSISVTASQQVSPNTTIQGSGKVTETQFNGNHINTDIQIQGGIIYKF
jgi:hypothetical protein